jgi:ribosomal-protein-alanine N-acetyltransferase
MSWETERLLFRPLVMTDLDDLYALYSNPLLMRYITGKPRSYEKTQERLLQHMSDFSHYHFGLYATILKSTQQMIGRCGIEPIEGPDGLEGEFAWMFATSYWGLGLATEFGRGMIKYSSTHFPIIRLYAIADELNLASIRVMQKIGMKFYRQIENKIEYELRTTQP